MENLPIVLLKSPVKENPVTCLNDIIGVSEHIPETLFQINEAYSSFLRIQESTVEEPLQK